MKINLPFFLPVILLLLNAGLLSCTPEPTPEPFPWTHFYEPLSCEDSLDGNLGGKLQAVTTFYANEGIDILEIEFDIKPDSRAIFITDQGCILYPADTKGIDIKVSEIHGDKLMNLNHGWQAY